MEANIILEDDVIVVGDKIDLVSQTGVVYRTMIEDRNESGAFLLGVPNRKGLYMPVYQDDDVYLVFYRDSGRYIAHMSVVALEKRGEVRYMWLIQKTKAQQNQRREAFRLPVSFNVQICKYIEDDENEKEYIPEEAETIALEAVNSRDISVTGIALITKKKYEIDEKYLLILQFSKAHVGVRRRPNDPDDETLSITATVKRCIPWRTANTYNTGMQFFGMTDSMSDGIARYVLTEQQRQIKKRRLS
jgi:c-di-GMP-binding flagellar brake protein YcgR